VACRQLAARARAHVCEDKPRYTLSDGDTRKIANAFLLAVASGDAAGLARLLADDAVIYSDGGGKRRTALKPIVGKDRILRYYDGVKAKGDGAFKAFRVDSVTLNGMPGYVFHTPEGTETAAFEVTGEVIVAIYSVRNPDKVRHLG